MWWFWWWMIFVLFLLFLPLGYGWGYRRWGYPYPSWTGRAREARVREVVTWGYLADFLWFVTLIALVLLIVAALV